jgi:hypothetical protein
LIRREARIVCAKGFECDGEFLVRYGEEEDEEVRKCLVKACFFAQSKAMVWSCELNSQR